MAYPPPFGTGVNPYPPPSALYPRQDQSLPYSTKPSPYPPPPADAGYYPTPSGYPPHSGYPPPQVQPASYILGGPVPSYPQQVMDNVTE